VLAEPFAERPLADLRPSRERQPGNPDKSRSARHPRGPESFYGELIEHGQVDRASNAARASVMTADLPGAAIPVLFMRLRSGQLLRFRERETGPACARSTRSNTDSG
jgi:hypothetical protein